MISFFIRRPIATTLLAIGLGLAGCTALSLLPVSPMPNIDLPTITVTASMAGASPSNMSSSVATPLERHMAAISGVTEMTSRSTLGSTQIVLQFDIKRNIDGAARDVMAAISAAHADLPTGLKSNPTYKKVNPNSQPILSLALTSKTLTPGEIFDQASNILQQRLSQIQGVGDATPQGASLPAVRVELNPRALFQYGISMADVSNAIRSANAGANSPKGAIQQGSEQIQVFSNDDASQASDFRNLIIAYRPSGMVRLSDVANVYDGQEDIRNVGMANGKPAVIVNITQQPGANVLEVVDKIKAILPELQRTLPSSIDPIVVVQDPTIVIRNSVHDVEATLIISTILVVLVVYFFLRNERATLVPAISVPLAILGTFCGMYAFGYSLDNFSLMALTISTGFVVDDTMVVLENITRHLEEGRPRMEAALIGTSEVAFTALSMSTSLIAVFLPILLLGGIVGKIFHEFAMTLSIAIVMSLVVALTVTPAMCAFLDLTNKAEGVIMRRARLIFEASLDFYRRTLMVSLNNPKTVMFVLLVTVLLNWYLYIIVPKGFFPQADEGRINGNIRGDQSISFQAMQKKFQAFVNIIRSDPAVATVAGYASTNSGSLFLNLKPPAQRGYVTSADVVDRLRPKFLSIAGAQVFLQVASATGVRSGGRQGNGDYQYSLQADEIDDLNEWVPKITDALQAIPELEDVNSDRQAAGLEIALDIDRNTAARLGLTASLIDSTLQNAFSQGSVSTIYKDKNQYRVIMEVMPKFWQSPETLKDIYVSTSGNINGTAASGIAGNAVTPAPTTASTDDNTTSTTSTATTQSQTAAVENALENSITGSGNANATISTSQEVMIPMSSFVKTSTASTALAVNHQGPFVATTFSYGVAQGVSLDQATQAINRTMARLNVPLSIHADFAGTAQLANQQLGNLPMLFLAALVTIYIVLGMLYESFVHPLTILSTLPSAGIGALLALLVFRVEFSMIAFIGVILLIGVVKKNAIIMIDFAIALQRNENISAHDAIFKACLLRFRPIMMTTMAAILGALPLAIGVGEGYELRQPLGISIVGGLLLSQALTLYTTPVIYLYLDRWRLFCKRMWNRLYDGTMGIAPPAAAE